MLFKQTKIKDLYTIQLSPFLDDRGFFIRVFCKNEFAAIRKNLRIVQINHSLTKAKGSIRGLHYQAPPYSETKVVRCIRGSVFDVAVDIRRNSKTFLQWYGDILTADNNKMLFIPEGFAHGFQTLENNSEMFYLSTEFYNKDAEAGFRYDDPALGIIWPKPVRKVSERDRSHQLIEKHFQGIKI